TDVHCVIYISVSTSFLRISTTRPPPVSTLFPYTTLFRSHLFLHKRLWGDCNKNHPTPKRPTGFCLSGIDLQNAGAQCGSGRRERDRKSTRLNSSHVKISYAVFCLKKKKRRHTTQLMKSEP